MFDTASILFIGAADFGDVLSFGGAAVSIDRNVLRHEAFGSLVSSLWWLFFEGRQPRPFFLLTAAAIQRSARNHGDGLFAFVAHADVIPVADDVDLDQVLVPEDGRSSVP